MDIIEKLIELKKTNPLFKDYDFKMHRNDLSSCSKYIDELIKQKEIEELNKKSEEKTE